MDTTVAVSLGRVTRRMSGRHKMTVTARHDLGGYELARLLCRYGHQWQPDLWDPDRASDRGRSMTMGQVRRLIADYVETYGRSAYLAEDVFSGDLTVVQEERVVVWAVSQVTRLYPALVDEALTDFLARAIQDRRDYEARLHLFAEAG